MELKRTAGTARNIMFEKNKTCNINMSVCGKKTIIHQKEFKD